MEQETQVRETVRGAGNTTTATRSVSTKAGPGLTGKRIVQYITGIIVALLAIRVILSLLGANRGNSFAELIYGTTYPLVSPFFGLFGYEFEYGVARLEIETLVAILVYGLIGWGISKLFTLNRV